MIGLNRYLRLGLAVSVIVHLAALAVGWFLVGASSLHAPPPEAMVVEVVTQDEMPRFEGMPSNLHSSGSETPLPANGKGPVTQAPPQHEQQSHQNPIQQREAKETPAPRPPAAEATQAELVRAEKTEPEKQDQSSERQPAASPPREQRPEQPNITEEVAQYLANGGPLGGGFAAPPVETNLSSYDWTVQFRERVGMCSRVPMWIDPTDKVNIKIRISFNRDGTLASPPRSLVAAPSAKQQALMDSAVDALGRCQPFTMLPQEKYKQWKTMEVYVTPLFTHW